MSSFQETKAKQEKAKQYALALFIERGAREARVERHVHGYLPQTAVVTVEVYRHHELTRQRIAVGTVEDVLRHAEKALEAQGLASLGQ